MPCGRHLHCILACQAESVVQSRWDKFSPGLHSVSPTHSQRWINPTFLCWLRAKQQKTFLAATWPSFRGSHLRSCWPLWMTGFSSVDAGLEGGSAGSSLDQWGYRHCMYIFPKAQVVAVCHSLLVHTSFFCFGAGCLLPF